MWKAVTVRILHPPSVIVPHTKSFLLIPCLGNQKIIVLFEVVASQHDVVATVENQAIRTVVHTWEIQFFTVSWRCWSGWNYNLRPSVLRWTWLFTCCDGVPLPWMFITWRSLLSPFASFIYVKTCFHSFSSHVRRMCCQTCRSNKDVGWCTRSSTVSLRLPALHCCMVPQILRSLAPTKAPWGARWLHRASYITVESHNVGKTSMS